MTSVNWREFWIPPSGPTTLAWVRIVIAAQALWVLLSRDPAGVSGMPAVIWQAVPRTWQARFLLVPGIPLIETVLWGLAVASLICVLLGYRTAVFGIVAGLLLYHLAPLAALLNYTAPWGKGLTVATLALPILACSPCEDRWSVASLRRPAPPRDPQAYGWAVMLVRFVFAALYFYTVIGRWQKGGLTWAAGDTVRNHILVFGLAEPSLNTPLNAWLVAHPLICELLSAGSLLLELVFIVAVFVRIARVPLALGGVAFHTGLNVTLGFHFPNIPHFLLFIDWNGEAKRRTPAEQVSPQPAKLTGA